jgi:hypothetical protein
MPPKRWIQVRLLAGALTRCLRGRPTDRLMVAVEHVGIEVVTVWPYDGAKFGIDAHLAEVGGVLQRLSHRRPKIAREIDLADQAVGERQPQPEASSGSTAVIRARRRRSLMAVDQC